MNRAMFVSLRSRLLLLVFLAGLPSLGLVWFTGVQERRHNEGIVEENALRLARVAAAEQGQFIASTRQFLMTLSQFPEVRRLDTTACNQLFAQMLARNPAYVNIGLVKPDGTICSSGIPLTEPLSLADRPYFQSVLRSHEFATGEYQIGRITRKPGVNCAYPVLDAAGRLTGVIFAVIDLNWLNDLAHRANLPSGSRLFLIDRNGIVLVRYPQPSKSIGLELPYAPLMKTVLDQHVGIIRSSGLDGMNRVYGFAPLTQAGDFPIYVILGVPIELAKEEASRTILHNMLWLGVVAMVALGAAWAGGDYFILRWLRVLVAATRRLGRGDLAARTGLSEQQGELGQLGRAFDEMARSLEEREAERQRATDDLRKLNEQLELRVTARTSELREKNEQMQSDLKMAREIQLAFLPQKYPSFPRDVDGERSAVRFCHRYLPTGDIGGDFFGVLPLSDTEVGVFICDVMGHGVRAALLTATLHGLLGELAPVGRDPSLFLSEMNRALLATLRRVNTTMFASGFYLVADVANGQLSFANAGHPSPLHVRRSKQTIEPLARNKGSGPALGLFPDSVYATARSRMAADDLVLLYTDGLYEVYDESQQQYGEDRLLAAFRQRLQLPCPEMFDQVLTELRQFSSTHTFGDDVCLLGMEIVRVGVAEQSQPVNAPTRARL